ncbi:MAG: Sir2 family NAD-dependent protein deacetylase [Spirochaetia bacterium]
MAEYIEKLLKLLKKSSYTVAFTGAGVSTYSGVADFRGKNGLYSRTDIDANKLFDISYFRHDPSYYYTKSRDFIYGLKNIEPSIVHTELARLEGKGLLEAVITQNIDLLHHKAGSKKVVEVHGSPLVHRCLSCNKTWDFDSIADIVMAGEVPECDECGGVIKPDITFFGEMLPADALEEAERLSIKAELMIVLGSSLVVQPAASIPLNTVRNGGTLVIVNDSPTPLDSYAELIYRDLGRVFTYISENLP